MNKKIEKWFEEHKKRIEFIISFFERGLGFLAGIMIVKTIIDNGFWTVVYYSLLSFTYSISEIAFEEMSKKWEKAKKKDMKERMMKND